MRGIDLSRGMLHEAHTRAQTLGRHNTAFCQADAEALPFSPDACDLVACKLAFHHFPHPPGTLAEMVRVATHEARMVLIDRVSSEDLERRAYQNRLEKLRTPGKIYVYSESQQEESLPCQPHLLAPPSSTGGSSSPRPFSSPW
jgi:ubiquinone/menaquinone biosynthesis C-methylase UbiE